MTFEQYKNFSLNPEAWGEGHPQDIVKLLDSVIIEFYLNLDLARIPNTPVLVCSGSTTNPPKNNPEIIKTNRLTIIFLSANNRLWSKYSYQFSHELCHYVIDTPFPPTNDKFGWWEETLCELASIYTLSRMSITWHTNPPYQNWASYANSLSIYSNDIINKPENTLTKPLSVWLSENLQLLFLDRYKRTENRIVAVNLLPLFNATPELWKTIQFLNPIQVTMDMTFETYLAKWRNNVPTHLHSNFDKLMTLLIGNTNLA